MGGRAVVGASSAIAESGLAEQRTQIAALETKPNVALRRRGFSFDTLLAFDETNVLMRVNFNIKRSYHYRLILYAMKNLSLMTYSDGAEWNRSNLLANNRLESDSRSRSEVSSQVQNVSKETRDMDPRSLSRP
jgi:hypothetical protein